MGKLAQRRAGARKPSYPGDTAVSGKPTNRSSTGPEPKKEEKKESTSESY